MQRDKGRSASRIPVRMPPLTLVCWHCGVKGHGLAYCPLAIAGRPQTPEGQKAYGDHCARTGTARVYDAKAMIEKFRQRPLHKDRYKSGSDSENEVTVISSNDNSRSSSRENSPYPSSSTRHAHTMKIVCSMKHINEQTQSLSSLSPSSLSDKQQLKVCLKKDSELSDMLGLPVAINKIDVSYSLVDQGASSGIITRSLMNSKNLKVREHTVHNHAILTSSGKEVLLNGMFLGEVTS